MISVGKLLARMPSIGGIFERFAKSHGEEDPYVRMARTELGVGIPKPLFSRPDYAPPKSNRFELPFAERAMGVFALVNHMPFPR